MSLLLLIVLMFQGGAGPAPVRSGVLVGQLKTIDGSSAAAVRVAAVAVTPANQVVEPGMPLQYIPPPAAQFGASFTDDEGRFRVANVPPGRYYLMASAGAARTYYPVDSSSQEPKVFTVRAGDIQENLDFRFTASLGMRIRGRVTGEGATTAGRLVATLMGSKVNDVLEFPVGADGRFTFTGVPPGFFTISLFPPPPGIKPVAVTMTNQNVEAIELNLPPTHAVTGRVTLEGGGPPPIGLLAFSTPFNSISVTVNPDGTFKTMLNETVHSVDIWGLPVGFRVASVRVGSSDVAGKITVGKSEISGVVVTIKADRSLPRISGRVVGSPNGGFASAKVRLTGQHILYPMETPIAANGSFDFPRVVPGLYEISISGMNGFAPMRLALTTQSVTDLELSIRP